VKNGNYALNEKIFLMYFSIRFNIPPTDESEKLSGFADHTAADICSAVGPEDPDVAIPCACTGTVYCTETL
jgi:hypothetical protein